MQTGFPFASHADLLEAVLSMVSDWIDSKSARFQKFDKALMPFLVSLPVKAADALLPRRRLQREETGRTPSPATRSPSSGTVPCAPPVPAKPQLRTVAWIGNSLICVFFLGFGLWSVTAPLKSAAIASGVVEPETVWAALTAESERCARLGWHTQLLTRLSVIRALEPRIAALPAPLVIDHFGRPDIDGPIDQPGFPALLRLLGTGHVWVKLSSIGRLCGLRPQDRISPFVRALAEARPDRLVWGSDWPHTGGGRDKRSIDEVEPFSDVDDEASLAALWRAIGDRAALHRILVDNPARLYGYQQ